MKRVIIILLFSFYFISITELHQFLKLPLLAEHFSEHKQKDNNLTLWKFLCLHYAHGDLKDADYDKDSKLPFKSSDNCNSSNTISILNSEQKFYFTAINTFTEKKVLNKHYTSFSHSTFLNSIWQPPKFC